MNAVRASFSILFLGVLLSLGAAMMGEILLATILLILVFLLCATGVILARRSDIVQLDLVFLAFLVVYSVSVPLSGALSSNGLVGSSNANGFVLCLLACLGFSVGCFFGESARKWRVGTHRSFEIDVKACRRSGYFTFFVSIAFSVVAIASTVGLSAYANAGYAGRALLKREAGPIELGLYSAVIGLIFILISYLCNKRPRKIDLIFFVLSTFTFVAYVSTLGIRRPTFLLILASLACVAIVRRKVGLSKAILFGIPLFLLFATFAQYRQVLSDSGLFEALYFISQNFSGDWFNVADTELGAPFRTLTDTLDRYRSFDYIWGKSYLITPIYILPSSFTGGVESMSMIYTREFFSDGFIAIGGNMGYFPVTEAYVNFGRIGLLIIFLVFALILSKLNFALHVRSNPNLIYIVFCCVLVPWLAFFMRLDVASFMKGFMYSQIVPLYISAFMYKKVFKSK